MFKKFYRNIKHKRLLGFTIFATALIFGFFVYKYAYIHLERRKYDQATVAIQKVAADLRAQGIETTFSRGCQHAEGVFGPGALSCSVGIDYRGNEEITHVKDVEKKLLNIILKLSFKYETESNSFYTLEPRPTGTSNYSLPGNKLICSLTFDNNVTEAALYSFEFTCGDNSAFNLF